MAKGASTLSCIRALMLLCELTGYREGYEWKKECAQAIFISVFRWSHRAISSLTSTSFPRTQPTHAQVLPYCLFNVAIMVALIVVDRRYGFHVVEISSQGHTFITMVVAFLLVSRVNTGLTRYNTARDAVDVMYREAREMVQSSVVFSNTNHDAAAQEWRHEVAYRSLVLLRTAVAVVDYPCDFLAPWDLPELNGGELEDVKSNLFLSPNNRRWAHGERTVWEEAMRVPIRIAYLLRKTLHSQTKRLPEPIQITQENKLLASVDSFMVGYYGMRKFLTTVCVSCLHLYIPPVSCE